MSFIVLIKGNLLYCDLTEERKICGKDIGMSLVSDAISYTIIYSLQALAMTTSRFNCLDN
jgi:hypothetical protein